MHFVVYMNIPVGLAALCLLYWSLQCFELEKTMPEFSWPALRSEFTNNFDYVGVSVHPFAYSFSYLINFKGPF